MGKSFYRLREGPASRNSTTISGRSLDAGHQWAGQRHLDYLGTVSLQFHGRFASISLKPVLRIVAAYVMVTAWSSRNYLLHMVRVSASVRQLTGYGSAYNL